MKTKTTQITTSSEYCLRFMLRSNSVVSLTQQSLGLGRSIDGFWSRLAWCMTSLAFAENSSIAVVRSADRLMGHSHFEFLLNGSDGFVCLVCKHSSFPQKGRDGSQLRLKLPDVVARLGTV